MCGFGVGPGCTEGAFFETISMAVFLRLIGLFGAHMGDDAECSVFSVGSGQHKYGHIHANTHANMSTYMQTCRHTQKPVDTHTSMSTHAQTWPFITLVTH